MIETALNLHVVWSKKYTYCVDHRRFEVANQGRVFAAATLVSFSDYSTQHVLLEELAFACNNIGLHCVNATLVLRTGKHV